jgi:hypothetical protein
MRHTIATITLAITLTAASNSVLGLDFRHWFNLESITFKPVRSDYDSEAAYAADSAVYGVPRTCTWSSRYGEEISDKGRVDDFQLGSNLRKSSNTNWYAISVSPRMASGALSEFLFVNGDNGAIGCGRKHLEQQGGDWASGGKWYKTFELVLNAASSRTKGKGSVRGVQTQLRSIVQGMSAEDICNIAITTTDGTANWETDKDYQAHVKEAIGRGFTPNNCSAVPDKLVKEEKHQLGKKGTIRERLSQLKRLVADGLLTESEASEKRKEILDGL